MIADAFLIPFKIFFFLRMIFRQQKCTTYFRVTSYPPFTWLLLDGYLTWSNVKFMNDRVNLIGRKTAFNVIFPNVLSVIILNEELMSKVLNHPQNYLCLNISIPWAPLVWRLEYVTNFIQNYSERIISASLRCTYILKIEKNIGNTILLPNLTCSHKNCLLEKKRKGGPF